MDSMPFILSHLWKLDPPRVILCEISVKEVTSSLEAREVMKSPKHVFQGNLQANRPVRGAVILGCKMAKIGWDRMGIGMMIHHI